MDEKIKQAMIDGVLDGVRGATVEQFRELRFGAYRVDDKRNEVRNNLSNFDGAARALLKLIEELPE